MAKFGNDGARAVFDSQQAAIDAHRELRRRAADRLPLRTAARLPLHRRRRAGRPGSSRRPAACEQLGIPATPHRPTSPCPSPFSGRSRFPSQAQLHPRRYLLALASDAVPQRGRPDLRGQPRAGGGGGRPCRVETADGVVVADHVIVAAHVPITNRVFLHTKIAAYRSYVVAARLEGPGRAGLFWDTAGSLPLHPEPPHRRRPPPPDRRRRGPQGGAGAGHPHAGSTGWRRICGPASAAAPSNTAGRARSSSRSMACRTSDATRSRAASTSRPATPDRG